MRTLLRSFHRLQSWEATQQRIEHHTQLFIDTMVSTNTAWSVKLNELTPDCTADVLQREYWQIFDRHTKHLVGAC